MPGESRSSGKQDGGGLLLSPSPVSTFYGAPTHYFQESPETHSLPAFPIFQGTPPNPQFGAVLVSPVLFKSLCGSGDTRNRFLACQKAGVEPRFEEWDGEGSLVAYVVSLNLHRRHLSESQRAVVADSIANLKLGANQHTSIDVPTQKQAAEMLNISVPSVQRMRAVRKRGVPELVEKVERGEMSVKAAEDLARLPAEQQKEVLKGTKKEIQQKGFDLCLRQIHPVGAALSEEFGL